MCSKQSTIGLGLTISFTTRYRTLCAAKWQKHQNFDAEVQANAPRLEQIKESGKKLIESGQYQSDVIAQRLAELDELWEKLTKQADRKGKYLQQANEEQMFTRNLEDFEMWLTDIEANLASEDMGRDLSTVQVLQKRQSLLEADVAAHKDRLDTFRAQATKFQEQGASLPWPHYCTRVLVHSLNSILLPLVYSILYIVHALYLQSYMFLKPPTDPEIRERTLGTNSHHFFYCTRISVTSTSTFDFTNTELATM